MFDWIRKRINKKDSEKPLTQEDLKKSPSRPWYYGSNGKTKFWTKTKN